MEAMLVAADGFPVDSTSVIEQLNLIEAAEWQLLIPFFDHMGPKGAFNSLKYIEHQRVMRRAGITIVYAILNLSTHRRIVLLDVICAPENSWGEVIKRIYNNAKKRK